MLGSVKAPLDFPPYTRLWRGSATIERKHAKDYLAFCKEITELLDYFGFTALSMDPGLAFRKGKAKNFRAEDCIELDAPAFREIVPLLYELRALREANARSRPARRVAKHVADRAARRQRLG